MSEDMHVFDIIGKTVKGKEGDVDLSSLTGEKKVIGLYFSAHWCPPCKSFTPKLAKWYEDVKNTTDFSGKLEIIFVSFDKDIANFKDYYKSMPWLAMDYENKEAKEQLSDKFEVSGIPCLIFLQGNGEMAVENGRKLVSEQKTDDLKEFL